ncbi:MAG: hypothetical protein HOL85_09330 [Rhodospirillaceae bacterium]|jgi:hypothetical protein|nr:hypothetical protein [Rhodospirillaceae bacterium]MBT6140144.1 hypothetical protein [Rhodospirillaceae bacterium]
MAGDKSSFEVIHPPNKLKDLVGQDSKIDPRMIEKAEEAVEQYVESVDLSEVCKPQMDQLGQFLDDIAGGKTIGDLHDEIYGVMHDLRGQGNTFGYPLVARIAASMNFYLENPAAAKSDASEHDVLRTHVDSLRGVLANKLKGDTGAIGQQIARGLEEITGVKVDAG